MKKSITLVIVVLLSVMGVKAAQTPSADGIYYLYNTDTGKFLSHSDFSNHANLKYNGGGQACVDNYGVPIKWIASDTDGAYYIQMYDHKEGNWASGATVYIGGDNWLSAWIQAGNASRRTFTLSEVSAENKTYRLECSIGSSNYLYVFSNETNEKYRVAGNGSSDKWTTWQFLSKAERDAIVGAYPAQNKTHVITSSGISATAETFESTITGSGWHTADKTSSIGTATFSSDYGDWTWYGARSEKNQPKVYSYNCEVWKATGYFSQTVADLPKGIYKVTVQGFERAGEDADCNTFAAEGYGNVSSYMEANGECVQFAAWYNDGTNKASSQADATTKFNAGHYKNEVYTYVGDDGELTIKVFVPKFVINRWVVFNNFTLTYYYDLSTLKAALEAKKATAEAITGLPTAAASALTASIAANDGASHDCVYDSEEAYNTAIDNMQGAIDLANSIKSVYTTYNSKVSIVNGIKNQDVYTDPGSVVSTYTSTLSTIETAVQAATTVAEIETQIANLYSALNVLMTSVSINEDAYFDLTSLITNPTFDSNSDGWEYKVERKWNNLRLNENCEKFMETWQKSTTLADSYFKQTLPAELPAGQYELKAAVNAIYQSDKSTPITGVNLYIQDVSTAATACSTHNDLNSDIKVEYFTVDYFMPSDADMTIGLDWTSTNANWICMDNVSLKYYGKNLTLYDTKDFSLANDVDNVNVTVNRAMTANVWNTLVIPFDMDIPSGWTVKEPTSFDGELLTFSDASSIEAGKPYIVKPTSAVTSFSATDVTLKKDLDPTTVSNLTMTGTYTAGTVSTGNYVIGIKDGVSALYNVNSTVSIKPFRAYFTVDSGSSVKANVINLNFDVTTSIQDALLGFGNESSTVYDLSGRPIRMTNMPKGVFIVNGKKIVVK
ncbi:MAG: hypothetical protein J5486_03365 [Bacteroidaceae bacterium]|nr:hypothetical protein [Bacteroidaceae bacterium]